MGEHEYQLVNARAADGSSPGVSASASDPAREPLLRVEPIPVRVRFAEHVSDGRWSVSQWRPEAVEPVDPVDPSVPAALAIEVFPDEAEGYYLNITSGDPSIMVRWRLPEDDTGVAGEAGEPRALAVTLSYNEAGRWMDGGERVDRVPMPAGMRGWLAEFVGLHWKPETKHKQRGPKPSFMRRNEFSDMVERERQRLLAAQAEAGSSDRPASRDDGISGPARGGQRG